MRLVYVLAYRAPNYIRSQSLVAGLKQCDGVELVCACNSSTGAWRYVEALLALRRIQRDVRPAVYVLGFRGYEIFWFVRIMSRGAPLVFDAMMSPSTALAEEGKAGLIGKLLAPIFFRLERQMLMAADVILTDTEAHAGLYVRRFAISRDKIVVLPVGAIEPNSPATSDAGSKPYAATEDFSVLFYGSMLPLHGVQVILDAAQKLTDLPIRFDFVGGSAAQARRLRGGCVSRGLHRFTHRPWLALDQLVGEAIPNADLCLGGPFGGTPQAGRVVTTKTAQALALGKAAVVGEGEEQIGFVDRFNCLLVPQADPAALAAAIRWAYDNRSELPAIGKRGRDLYREKLSVAIIARRFCEVLDRLMKHDR